MFWTVEGFALLDAKFTECASRGRTDFESVATLVLADAIIVVGAERRD